MDNQQRKLVRIGLFVLLFVLLTVLLLLIFGDRPTEARNTRTVSQLQQYMNALELVRADTGEYPGPDDLFVCLGDYADNACWDVYGTGVKENEEFQTALIKYIPLLSSGAMVEDKGDSKAGREGYIYKSFDNGNGYEIQYMLAGKDKNCALGEPHTETLPETAANTLCRIRK